MRWRQKRLLLVNIQDGMELCVVGIRVAARLLGHVPATIRDLLRTGEADDQGWTVDEEI